MIDDSESDDAHGVNRRTIDFPRLAEQVGTTIGPYRLLKKLGEGGMGVVYMAEQHQPVRRRVALKIIKPGFDSGQVVARFEAERQALAMMDHQNIAKVFDVGSTDSGQPFFVMELVHGLPITDFCDSKKLSTRERLELLIPVCQAIQHAHQKGVIHRDIKPSNVMVCVYDDQPVPKIIDFGVAKAMDQRLTERTLCTQYGAIVGTMEYMSPEQADISQLGIDTRSDIYSLGVLLYELLTGTTPVERERFQHAALLEMLRIIKEEDPPPPSSRLSHSGEALSSISQQRSIDPGKLSRLVRGELDWITMKCLEKERARRYETANALARDLQRYLADEPVEAGPPSACYRLRKFLRRNRGFVAASSVLLIVVLVGFLGTLSGLHRANEAKALAEKRFDQIRHGVELIASIFVDLDPNSAGRDAESLREVLADRLVAACQQLDDESIADSEDVAHLQNLLGQSLVGLDRPKPAVELFKKVLERYGPDEDNSNSNVLAVRSDLAMAMSAAGQAEEAVAMMNLVLAARKATVGPRDVATLTARDNLGACFYSAGMIKEAADIFKEVLDQRREVLDSGHPDLQSSMNNLANAYRELGKFDESVVLFRSALASLQQKLGPDHPKTLITQNCLALAMADAKYAEDSIPLFEQTLDAQRRMLGRDHADTLITQCNLARALQDIGEVRQAISLLELAVESYTSREGRTARNTLTAKSRLALAYKAAGQLDKVIPLTEENLRNTIASQGKDHLDTIANECILAKAYSDAGRLEDSIPLHEHAVRHAREILGSDHPHSIAARNNLAFVYQDLGRNKEALAIYQELSAQLIKQFGPRHPTTLAIHTNLGAAYQQDGQIDRAITLLETTLADLESVCGKVHEYTVKCQDRLNAAYRNKNDSADPPPRSDEMRSAVPENPSTVPPTPQGIP